MKKKRWGKKYVDKTYISLDFIESWKKELEEMNKGKEGQDINILNP